MFSVCLFVFCAIPTSNDRDWETGAIIANGDDVTRNTKAEAGHFQLPAHSGVAPTRAARCKPRTQGSLDMVGQRGARISTSNGEDVTGGSVPLLCLHGKISHVLVPKGVQWLLGQAALRRGHWNRHTLGRLLLCRRSTDVQTGCSTAPFSCACCAPQVFFLFIPCEEADKSYGYSLPRGFLCIPPSNLKHRLVFHQVFKAGHEVPCRLRE